MPRRNLVYAGLMEEEISLGEYVRRLRRGKGLSLHALSEETGLSYSHLSRIENDSTLPGPETITKLVEVLGGDLRQMLAMAKCLPKMILERIQAQGEPATRATLHRTAGAGRGTGRDTIPALLEFATDAGLDRGEAEEVASAMAALCSLPPHQRLLIAQMILGFAQEGNAQSG